MKNQLSYQIIRIIALSCILLLLFASCNKNDNGTTPVDNKIVIDSVCVNDINLPYNKTINNISIFTNPQLKIVLAQDINPDYFTKETVQLTGGLNFDYHFIDNRTIQCDITTTLKALTSYKINIPEGTNDKGGNVVNGYTGTFRAAIDSTDKYPRISDEELLTKVQHAAFNFFWEFNPFAVSGLAHEGTGHSPEIATIGGSGFGIAAIPVAVERGFITRAQGLERMQKIIGFLSAGTTDRFHGAFPHWINGETGKVIPFSAKDDGADLVETAFLMEGLIIARQYFSLNNPEETTLRDAITSLFNEVEWDWFRQNEQNVLYWHWSPNYSWDMNMKIQGWNECLIVYILAAGSPGHSIDLPVYTEGWAKNGSVKNGKNFYDITLPLGESYGGPLFFAHYSFIGLNAQGLSDQYADYWEQNRNHTLINRQYCIVNPKNFVGYSADCWGLTAGNIPAGYNASSPTNDVGTITPTAALSSMPYTPEESMQALHFFYYKLGDKIWNGDKYGFYDGFDLNKNWVSPDVLAIDQLPIVCMIENYRTGLLWNLFMSAPEVQAGLQKLSFSYPPLEGAGGGCNKNIF